MIPGISPTGQYTQIMTLTSVIAVSAIKAAYEDWKRHKSDVQVRGAGDGVGRGRALGLTAGE